MKCIKFKYILFMFFFFFVLFLSNDTQAHVSYYNDIQTFTNGLPWVLFENTSGNTILCVSPTSSGTYNGMLSIGGASSSIAFLSYSPSNSSNNIQKFNYFQKNSDNTFSFIKNDYGYNNATGIGAIQRVGSDYSNLPSVLDMNYSVLWMGQGSTIAIDVSNYSSVNPYFVTSLTDLSTFNFDFLQINGGTTLYNSEYPEGVYHNAEFKLRYVYKGVSSYIDILDDYVVVNEDTNTWSINIPYNVLTNNVVVRNGENFDFYFTYSLYSQNSISINIGGTYNLTSSVEEQVNQDNSKQLMGELENAQKETNKKLEEQNLRILEQTNAINESTEVNRNIFQKIGDILSYINPFSENFFVYKLIELLGNLLKSLFVPDSDFMSSWFTAISDYFEDAFGILYYPIDLVIQVMGRFGNISSNNPVISFGNFELFGVTLIPAYSYNFNSILTNNTINTVHDFYLIAVDVILWLSLLIYCKNVLVNIFGGKFVDDVVDDVNSNNIEKSRANYKGTQKGRQVGFGRWS